MLDPIEPIPLNPKYEPTAEELLATVLKMKAAVETAQKAILDLEPAKPWNAVARLTAKTEPSARVWSRANESRMACDFASEKHWREIRAAGLWHLTLEYAVRRSRVRWSVFRLYLAAFLHTFCCLGVLNLRRDQEVLAAWCQ